MSSIKNILLIIIFFHLFVCRFNKNRTVTILYVQVVMQKTFLPFILIKFGEFAALMSMYCCFHRYYLKCYMYLAQMEALNIPYTLEMFISSPKEGMIKGLWKNHNNEPQVDIATNSLFQQSTSVGSYYSLIKKCGMMRSGGGIQKFGISKIFV